MTHQLLITSLKNTIVKKDKRQRRLLCSATFLGEKYMKSSTQNKPLHPAFQAISKQISPKTAQELLYIEVCKKTVYQKTEYTSPYTIHQDKGSLTKRSLQRFNALQMYLERAFCRRQIRLRETNPDHLAYLIQELWEQAEAVASGLYPTNDETLVGEALPFSLAGRELLHIFQNQSDRKAICKEQIASFSIKAFLFAEKLYSLNKN